MKVILSICEVTNTSYSKKDCYDNLNKVFLNHELYVLGDNLSEEFSLYIKSTNPTYFENKVRGRQRWMLDKLEFCINHFDENDTLYLVEDDYLHNFGAAILIDEGLNHSEYVTLYDHPDKYGQHPHKNPEIQGLGESTILFRTDHSHWKYTNSTTATFACKKRILVEDSDVWKKHINKTGWWDYQTFIELRSKFRKIAVCIPGQSTHVHSTIMYSPFFHTDI
jgi:hypothetical protein